jgi:hypothetical protein
MSRGFCSPQMRRERMPFWFLKVVGAVRFELTTSCTRNKRATRLRYAPPTKEARKCTHSAGNANIFECILFSGADRGTRRRVGRSYDEFALEYGG